MKDARKEYEAALADFRRGATWVALEAQSGKPTFVFWGKAAGMSADEIIADAHANGVTNRDSDIRRCWNSAHPQGDQPQRNRLCFTPRARPKPPPTFPCYVRDIVAAGGGAATSADLLDLSPVPVVPTPQLQTRDFLRACFDGGDLLFIDSSECHQAGRPGENIRSADEWVRHVCLAGDMGGDLITPNPLTGEKRETVDERGRPKKSFILADCIARWPFLIVEFDDVRWMFGGDVAKGLAWQCAFWHGLLTKSPLAPTVAAIVFTGGKSLHGLLHIGAATRASWDAARDAISRLLAADPAEARKPKGDKYEACFPFRADRQAMEPHQKVRLPGVRRRGDGCKLQRMLYLNPEAVRKAGAA